jgi:tetratricopeptide (TPR) repeat protein
VIGGEDAGIAPGRRVAAFLGRVLAEDTTPAGTCFQVALGVLVTAWHVLDGIGAAEEDALVQVDPLAGGDAFDARVRRLDPTHDLAIMVADASLPAMVRSLAETDRLPKWAKVTATGHAQLDDEGHTYRFLDALGTWAGGTTRDGDVPLGRMIADRVVPGMSGAPVVRDGDGVVVGVVSGRYNSADGWPPSSVWVARTEDLARLLEGIAEIAMEEVSYAEASAAPAVAHALPADVASFTGRQGQMEQLMRTLPGRETAGGVVSIDAIDGMAGVGKTAFAVHAAHRLASRFPDGQLFVSLHGHTSGRRPVKSADALATLLLADGVAPKKLPAGLDARAALWRDRMAGRRALLLLDDATDSDQVRPLLPGTAGMLVLVTSRHRLTALPEALPVTLDILEAGEAAQLFARLAGRPGILPEEDAVADVVARCGRLPLAISLMAGQLKHHAAWTAADLAAELALAADRLAPLAAENYSVTASFDLSYRNLRADRQRLFRRLGLHPGTDIDAYATAALNDTDLATAHRLLDELFDYHLISEPARGRYRFHDLIREHARALAAAEPPAERDAAVRRLLDYYLYAARAADRHLARRTPAGVPAVIGIPPACTPDLSAWKDAVAWMDAERLNLSAAVGYAALHDLPGHAVAIPAAMTGFLRTQGHWDQALTLHGTALESARHSGDRLAEAGALTDLGGMQRMSGDYPAAAASHARALKLYRDLGDRLGEANALSGLGIVQYLTPDYPAATASLSRALELFGDLGDRRGVVGALFPLGVVQRLTGDYRAAGATQARARELYRDLGDRLGEANTLNELGVVQHMTGDYPAAAASQAQALELLGSLGDRLGQANALTDLGIVQHLTGDYRAAAASHTRALELYRDLGNQLGEANALNNLAVMQYVTGQYLAATEGLVRALALCRGLGDRLGEANVLADLGAVHSLTADYDAATTCLTQALELLREVGSRHGEASTLHHLAVVQRLTGDYRAAAASLARALELVRDLGNRIGEAEVLNNMGELALASASSAEARASHEQALAIATGIAAPIEEARALEGIGRCHLQDGKPGNGAAQLRRALAIYERIGSANAQRVETTLRDHDLDSS